MKRQMRWLFVILTLLVLASLACSTLAGGNEGAGGANKQDSSSVSVNEGSADSEGAASAVESEGPQSLDMLSITSGLDDANSYRLRMDMRVESPDGSGAMQTVSLSMETAAVLEPPALQSDIRVEGDEDLGELGDLQLIQVGGTAYTTMPGVGCISGSAAEFGADINPFADLLDSGELVGDVSGARRVFPDENINGVDTYHFTFDETAITDPSNELEEVDGHIYVAKESGHLVRMVMDGVGKLDMFDSGLAESSNIHVEVNISDIDQPIVIEAPADCTSFDFGDFEIPDLGFDSSESPYPVLESAQSLFVLDELVSYETADPFAEVLAFYQAEMPAAGFDPTSDGTVMTDETAVLNFVRDDIKYTVTISGTEGDISVLITSQ